MGCKIRAWSLGSVVLQSASRESRLGRRVSKGIVEIKVWGLGGGVLNSCLAFRLRRAPDCGEGRLI